MKKILLVLVLAAGCSKEPRLAWEVQGTPLGTFEAVEEGSGLTWTLRAECTVTIQPDQFTCYAPISSSLRGRRIRIRRTVEGVSSDGASAIQVPLQ